MAAGVTVECPGCSAKLKMSDDSKLGKKVKCPKCSGIFVARLGDDEFEDLDDDFDQDDIPAPKFKGRKGPAASNKKRPARKPGSSGGASVVLMSGGAIAVLMLVGVVLYFSGVFSRGPAAVPAAVAEAGQPASPPADRILGLRWMPADTEMLVHIKLADLWQSPLLKSVVDSAQASQPFLEVQNKIGLAPGDVESISIGVRYFRAGIRAVVGAIVEPEKRRFSVPAMAVIRTKKPLSLDSILNLGPAVRPAQHGSQKCFEFDAPYDEDFETFAGWIADPTTLIIGLAAEMNAVIERGESVSPRRELLVIDPKSQLVLVVASNNPQKDREGEPVVPPTPDGASPHVAALLATMRESFLGAGLGVNLGTTVEWSTALLFRNSNDAGKAKADLELISADWRKQLDSLKAFAPPALTELGTVLLNSLKIEVQSDIVRMSTMVPVSERQKLDQAMSLVPQPPKTAPDPNQSQGIPGNGPQR